MGRFLYRFDFNVEAAKMDGLTWAIIIGVWVVVVACAIGSVFALGQRFTPRQRWGWIALIAGLPVVGLLIYLPFSVMRDGLSALQQSKGRGSKQSSGAARQ